jgi:hypothetical protein
MFEEHMAPRGPLNLFSYFPKGSLLPDLGEFLFIFVLLNIIDAFFSVI